MTDCLISVLDIPNASRHDPAMINKIPAQKRQGRPAGKVGPLAGNELQTDFGFLA
ncbi:MAG: hypothetical protein WAV95_04925 [Azonexus sp.]